MCIGNIPRRILPNEMQTCIKDLNRHLLFSKRNRVILPVVNQKVPE